MIYKTHGECPYGAKPWAGLLKNWPDGQKPEWEFIKAKRDDQGRVEFDAAPGAWVFVAFKRDKASPSESIGFYQCAADGIARRYEDAAARSMWTGTRNPRTKKAGGSGKDGKRHFGAGLAKGREEAQAELDQLKTQLEAYKAMHAENQALTQELAEAVRLAFRVAAEKRDLTEREESLVTSALEKAS